VTMKNRSFGQAGIICFALALLFFCQQASARSSVDQYEKTVTQLRKDGYKGIDAALVQFEALIHSDPDFTEAYVGAADALLVKYEFSKNRSGKWMPQALDYLNVAIARRPAAENYYFKRALIYLNLKKPDLAEADLKKAVALKPGFLKAQVLYLQYLLSAGRTTEARRLADEWTRSYGADPAPCKYFGDLFFQARAYEDSLVYYRQVARKVKKAPNTHAAMGRAYWELGQRKEAIAAFRQALQQDPDLYPVHFALGTCLAEAGDLKGAVDHYRQYLKQVPDDAAALNNLALLHERIGNKAQAQLAWMKLKSKTGERVYLQRAETHLYRLAYEAAGKEKAPAGSGGSGTAAKGQEKNE